MSPSSSSTSHAPAHPHPSSSTLSLSLPLGHRTSHRSTSTTSSHSHSGTRHRSLCRQDARLGVSTSYTDLSLHSACANGNVGLVQYALTHGQPVNSVLNGVLPLHAAASSGNETVVRMLIEAGADVNSPRLPRRYTNERTKVSGPSVGTAGSTPLHFAAANGHTSIAKLLLSYGADPRVAEKHGITPEMIAVQNGHVATADALRSFAPVFGAEDPEAEYNDDEADVASLASGSASGRSIRGLSLSSAPSSKSGGKSKRRLSTHVHLPTSLSLHPQRSYDALAQKLHHSAHAHAGRLASSPSLQSLASSLASAGAGSPNPSTSQISLGAVGGLALDGPSGPAGDAGGGGGTGKLRRASHSDGSASGSGASGTRARRPSLPSVWEKAAHPRAALKHALGMSALKGRSQAEAGAVAAEAGSSRASVASSLWGSATTGVEEEEEEEARAGEDEQDGAEVAERRRSLEVHRPLRQDSFQGGAGGTIEEDPPPSSPTPTPSTAFQTQPPLSPRAIPALARAASQHQFYRPRQSSQLSTQSFSGRRPSLDEEASPQPGADGDGEVFEDSPPPSQQASPSRPRAFSNPVPGLPYPRSPLLQQVHSTSASSASPSAPPSARSREPSAASLDTAPSTTTPGSSRPSTAGGGALGDTELSSAESSGASRVRNPPPPALGDVRRAWAQQAAQPQQQQARDRSNSASTDSSMAFTRFSSSPTGSSFENGGAGGAGGGGGGGWAYVPAYGQGLGYAYAPSTSTAPTSVAPSSPGAGARAAFPAPPGGGTGGTGKRGLAPLYEGGARITPALGAAGEEKEPTTRAQARKRVQQAERELLAFNPSSSSLASSSPGGGGAGSQKSGASSSATGGRSLKDQLAAYGRSLRVEKELAEKEERERAGAGRKGGYTFETIGTSSKAPAAFLHPPSAATSASTTPVAVPTWRAVPSSDRLVPPPAHLYSASGKRSASPSQSRRASKEDGGASNASKTPTATPPKDTAASSATVGAVPARAHSPTSIRSGKTLAPSSAPVLGQGPGGISFVSVQAAASSSANGAAHHARASRSDRSHSDKGGSSISGSGGVGSGLGSAAASANGKISTREQIEEDRRRREEIEGKVPRAVRTAPEKKKGLRRLFGGGGGSGGK
ncbi:hypothetical protein JCM10207_008547 [Rhodosporidiobolus poonsookiae]